MRTVLKLLRIIALVISQLIALCLISACVAGYIPPAKAFVFGFLGLAWLPLFLFNLFFLLLWIIVRFKNAILPALALIISFTVAHAYFAFHFHQQDYARNKNTLRVMSYNIHNFDLYNYKTGVENRRGMFGLIKNVNPDVACFQEYYSDTSGFKNTRDLLRLAGFKYYHFEVTTVIDSDAYWGMATFSRYPIINTGRVTFKNKTKNGCIYNDIKVGDSIIRVYNVHLQSVYFKQRSYKQLDSVNWDKDGMFVKLGKALSNMKLAYLARAEQAELVASSIATSPYPVIVCGDFNDTPSSYAYRAIRGDLQDAFLEKGRGIGHSYTGFPYIFRIDYILPDNHFKVMSYSTVPKDYSDHYPVVVDLERK